MSLTPEELRKYAQNFDQPYRALNPVKCLELADELERLQIELDILNKGKSPCGHWSAHAISGDDGKTIQCLECQFSTYKEALEAAEIELLRARNTLEAFEYQLAQTKLVEGIYAVLTQVRKVLRKGINEDKNLL